MGKELLGAIQRYQRKIQRLKQTPIGRARLTIADIRNRIPVPIIPIGNVSSAQESLADISQLGLTEKINERPAAPEYALTATEKLINYIKEINHSLEEDFRQAINDLFQNSAYFQWGSPFIYLDSRKTLQEIQNLLESFIPTTQSGIHLASESAYKQGKVELADQASEQSKQLKDIENTIQNRTQYLARIIEPKQRQEAIGELDQMNTTWLQDDLRVFSLKTQAHLLNLSDALAELTKLNQRAVNLKNGFSQIENPEILSEKIGRAVQAANIYYELAKNINERALLYPEAPESFDWQEINQQKEVLKSIKKESLKTTIQRAYSLIQDLQSITESH